MRTESAMKAKGTRTLRKAAVLLAASFVTMAIGGCQTAGKHPIYESGSVPDINVKLEPGDMIETKFYYAPELNESQRVRPDGKITLQLIGDVEAAGREPAALQEELKERYTGLIDKPEVTVFVRDMNNRAIFVGGAVKIPGRFPMTGTLTALAAILQAGGFDMTQAAFNNVVVIRQEAPQPSAFVLDFTKTLQGEPGEPFYLHAQDLVIVPKTKISNLNQWIDQYLNRIVPQFGFTYTRPVGDGTIGLDTSQR